MVQMKVLFLLVLSVALLPVVFSNLDNDDSYTPSSFSLLSESDFESDVLTALKEGSENAQPLEGYEEPAAPQVLNADHQSDHRDGEEEENDEEDSEEEDEDEENGKEDEDDEDEDEEDENDQLFSDVLTALRTGVASDNVVDEVEAMLGTSGSRSKKLRTLKKRSWRPAPRRRVLNRLVYTPEPKDKNVPADPFAVPNVPPKKGLPRRSILSFDAIADPLPYASKYTRFRKVVSEKDFAPEVDPKEFRIVPMFDPVSDPLMAREGRTLPNVSKMAFKLRNGNQGEGLFSNVLPGIIGNNLDKKEAGRNTATIRDQTWQDGEFRGGFNKYKKETSSFPPKRDSLLGIAKN